jgi:hypothetical protein
MDRPAILIFCVIRRLRRETYGRVPNVPPANQRERVYSSQVAPKSRANIMWAACATRPAGDISDGALFDGFQPQLRVWRADRTALRKSPALDRRQLNTYLWHDLGKLPLQRVTSKPR